MLEEEKKEELLALLTGKKYRELKSRHSAFSLDN